MSIFHFYLAFATISITLAVRKKVKLFGTTLPPGFEIPAEPASIRCPHDFPYAFDNGNQCCRSKFESDDPDKHVECNGESLNFYSPCCMEDDARVCKPSNLKQRCKDYSSGIAVLLTGISSVLNGVLLVDLDNQCTKRLADFPEDMIYMGAEYLEGKIVTLGGNNGGTVSSYSYDPATDEWSSLPDFPFVISHSDLVPYMSGTDHAQLLQFGSHPFGRKEVHALDLDDSEGWKQSDEIPTLLEHVFYTCGVQVSPDVIVYGGGISFQSALRNKIWLYRISSGQWVDTGLSLASTFPRPVECIQLPNGKVMFLKTDTSMTEILDPVAMKLTTGPELPESVDMFPPSLFIWKDKLHVLTTKNKMYRLEINERWRSVSLDFLPMIDYRNRLVTVPRELFEDNGCA